MGTFTTYTESTEYKVQFYSKKKPFKRRQYAWRTVHRNGNEIERSSESYNNKADRDEAFYRLTKALANGSYSVVDLDKS